MDNETTVRKLELVPERDDISLDNETTVQKLDITAFSSSEQCKVNPFPAVELEEWCKDNALVEDDLSDYDYQVEDDCLENKIDCLEDEENDCLIDDYNCFDDEDSQLEDDHEDTDFTYQKELQNQINHLIHQISVMK